MTETTRMFNNNQSRIRQHLRTRSEYLKAIDLILVQNALVHPSEKGSSKNSLEDEIWNSGIDITLAPKNGINSIGWHLWHSARIEDIATSFFLTKNPQIFEKENFHKRLNVSFKHTGNDMTAAQMSVFNSSINVEELKNYRIAVGKAASDAIRNLSFERTKEKVPIDKLQEIRAKGFVSEESKWLLDFWGRKNVAGIILMPLTRHLMVHINQSKRLMKRGT
jgi:hypothetical protein